MNLGEIYIKIEADTSPISSVEDKFAELQKVAEQVSSGVDGVQKAISSLESSMVAEVATGFSHASSSGNDAADSTRSLAQELQDAVTKGELLADVVGGAFNTIIGLAKSAASAVADFIGGSVGEFASYEQNMESLGRTFGDYSGEFSQWMQDNSSTFGISINEMMEHANKMGIILQKDNAQRREADAAGEQASTDMQKQELGNRLQDLRASLSSQLAETREAQQAEYDSWRSHYAQLRKELSEQLQDEYDSLKDYLEERVEAQKRANEIEYRERERALEDSYDKLKSTLDDEVSAFSKATDARVKEINREYTERYKLIDEQKYAELKAIQDRIDAIDAEREAKKRSLEDDKNNAKLSELQEKLASARLKSTRAKLQKDIDELQASMRSKSEDRALSDEKKSLQKQRDTVKDHYDDLKSELKEQQDDEVSAYKSARGEQLEILKRSNAERLKEAKRANQDELRALKDAQKQTIDAMVAENESILKEKKRSNQQILDEQQAAQNEQLRSLKSSQAAQLREIQEHNRKVLQEQSNLVAQQKKALSEAGGGYAEVTSEDQRESMKTLKMMFQTAADVAAARNMTTEQVLGIFESTTRGMYATLDNLGLGYANKTGFKQMVADMGEALGTKLDPDNFNHVALALSTLVDRYHMSGQAAYESVHTISGSMNALKANLANLKLALATDGVKDDETFLHQLFYGSGKDGDEGAVINFINNVIPVIKRILDRLVEFIRERGPEITKRLKEAIPEDLVPQKVWDVLDAILKIAEKLGDALIWVADNMDTVVTAIEAVGTALGFVTLLNTVMKVKKVVEFLAGAKGIKSVTDALGGLKGAASNAAGSEGLGGVGKAASSAAGSEGLGGLGTAASGLGGTLAAVLGPTALATTVFAGVAGLTGYILDATGATQRFQESVTKAVEDGTYDATELFTHVSQKAEETHRKISEAYNGAASEIDVSTSKAAKSVAENSEAIQNSVKGQADATGNWTDAIKNFFSELTEKTTTSSGEMKSKILTDLDSIKTGVDVGTASIGSSWGVGMSDMKKSTIDTSSGIKVETAGMLSSIKSNFDGSRDMLKESGNSVVAGFGEGAEHGGAWDNVKGFFKGILDWIVQNKGPIDVDRQALVPAGNAIVEGLRVGAQGEPWQQVKGFFGGMRGEIESNFNGSDTWLEGHGNDVMSGLNDGITNMYTMVSDFMGQMQGNMESPFYGSESWLVNSGDEIISGLYSGLGRMWDMVNDWFYNLPDMISGAFSNASDWLFAAGQNVISGFWDGLTDAFTGVQDWVGGVGEWIAQHKGPKQYDLKLLVPNGRWIMKGFEKGLRDQFPEIENAVSDISDLMSIDANMSVRRADNPWESGKVRGDNILNVYVGEMSVRSKEDIYSVSRELNSIWNREMNGAIA